MATQLFLRAQASQMPVTQLPWAGPGTHIDTSGSWVADTLSTTRGSGAANSQHSTTPGGSVTLDGMMGISRPLSAAATISGSVTFNIWADENSMNANVQLRGTLYKLAPDGTMTLIVAADRGVELGFSGSALNNWSATPGAGVSMAKGDCLLLLLSIKSAPATTMASGFLVNIASDSPTGAVAGDSYVSTTENLTFAADPAGTILYPTTTTSDIATADDDRKLAFSRGNGSATADRVATAGPVSPMQFQMSGTNVRWYSPQLQATTLSGAVDAKMRYMVSIAGGQATMVVELIKRTAGGTETTLAKGGDCANGLNQSTESTAFGIRLAVPDTAIADGDRLGLIVYIDDSARSVMGGSSTVYLWYNGVAAAGSGDTYLTFSQTLAELVTNDRTYAATLTGGGTIVYASAKAGGIPAGNRQYRQLIPH